MNEFHFPIDRIKNEILDKIQANDFLIIKSTPGSGKTTRVPIFLREKYKKKIYILEPRKLAAKLAAQYVAKGIGEQSGRSVGHIFRYENNTSPETQIIFLTEGTFVRLLTENKNLKDTDVIILDEFHERHYQTDVALSFLLEIKKQNPALKIIIMSATLELSELENLLKERVSSLELNERKHQLKVEYLPNNTLVLKDPLEKKILNALSDNWHRPGHVLIFLPGMAEIRKCEDLITGKFQADIVILHSEVAGLEIDQTYYDLTKRKIILSTNIAESSVTIPGVRTVIDSGLHRTSDLNVVTRLPQVSLQKISQSSAIQRANRASREDDGLAIRLYAELDYLGRPAYDSPEINRVDLSELIMTASDLFGKSPSEMSFVTPLNSRELKRAEDFLEDTGQIKNKNLTEEGRRNARTPFHPRIARILSAAANADEQCFSKVIRYLADMAEPRRPDRFMGLARKFFKASGKESLDVEKCILFGYFDQLAKLQNRHQLIHNNGEVYTIAESVRDEVHPEHSLWLILGLDNRNQVTRLIPVEEEWLYDLPSFPIKEEETFEFDVKTLRLKVERLTKVGSIVLGREKIQRNNFSPAALDFASRKISEEFTASLNKSDYVRLQFLEKYSDKKIHEFDSNGWLKDQMSFLLNDSGHTLESVKENYIIELFHFLNTTGEFDLSRDLPLHLQLHDKRKVPLHYDLSNGIHCESYLQDFYGLSDAPAILKGREKIKIHLLGPHKRALQVTQDLRNFWTKTYKELVKELKRDYPRHYWPDNPESAKPVLLLRNVQ